MMMMMIINKNIHKMHEKCIFYKFSVFKISVILKNTEKWKKKFGILGQFHWKKFSVSVNFSVF